MESKTTKLGTGILYELTNQQRSRTRRHHAHELEAAGPGAFFDFAVAELVELFGSGIRARLRPLIETGWGRDPFALGSYSYAFPGHADARAALAAPVDGRVFFAGEACSPHDFTTAHGAYLTGIEAADEAIALSPPGI
jgi:monoamine oxidase